MFPSTRVSATLKLECKAVHRNHHSVPDPSWQHGGSVLSPDYNIILQFFVTVGLKIEILPVPGLPVHGLSRLTHTELHWLDVPDQVRNKLSVLVYRCQHNQASQYLMDHCSPVSDVVFRQRLRSTSSHQLSIPSYQLSTYGRRAFSVAGPTVWNSLPEDLRDPACCADSYRQLLKTFLFSQY